MKLTDKSTLTQHAGHYIDVVNHVAEEIRAGSQAFGATQFALYQEKVEQATDYIADGSSPNLDDYPLLKAESEATNNSAKYVADSILIARSQWLKLLVKVEQIRLKANKQIREAKSVEDMAVIHSDAVEQLRSIKE